MSKSYKEKAFLQTALEILFDNCWLEPEKAAYTLYEIIGEAGKDLYPDERIDQSGVRRNWMQRFSNEFTKLLRGEND
jgi:hypothetical protein